MGIKKLAAKVADYKDRLDRGKASKIKPDHVAHVLEKLRKKEAALKLELAAAKNSDSKNRLTRKISVAQEQINRAEWLLSKIA